MGFLALCLAMMGVTAVGDMHKQKMDALKKIDKREEPKIDWDKMSEQECEFAKDVMKIFYSWNRI